VSLISAHEKGKADAGAANNKFGASEKREELSIIAGSGVSARPIDLLAPMLYAEY
jgi:hypothetical protein